MTEPTPETVVKEQHAKLRKKRWLLWTALLTTPFALVLLCLAAYSWRDQRIVVLPYDPDKPTVGFNPDDYDYIVPDCRFVYDSRQEEDVLPIQENGWRLLLQALGPAALCEQDFLDRIPWEELPEHKDSKEWLAEYWIPTCEKFELDPFAIPEMYGRATLQSYLMKHGITGSEPDPEDDSKGEYWENFEPHFARVSEEDVKSFIVDSSRVWTAEDSPTAAQWLEENGDLFDLFALAARMPRFRGWHFFRTEAYSALDIQLSDVQYCRDIARLLSVRARYRIGLGDVSGALDDVETILLIAQSLLESNNLCEVESLVGIALLGIAASLPVFENRAPTADELSRMSAMWKPIDVEFTQDVASRVDRTERLWSLSYLLDFLQERKKSTRPFSELIDAFGDTHSTPATDRFVKLAPCDDRLALKALNLYWSGREKEMRFSLEKAYGGIVYGYSVYAAKAYGQCLERLVCVRNLKLLQTAFARYLAEHETLPPAFTVGESGKPLHSWRVLLLPYLGDDARALYNQIRLDEPWDSEYNSQFHGQAPSVFRCPRDDDNRRQLTRENSPLGENRNYVVLISEDGLFDRSGTGRSPDGVSPQHALVFDGRDGCWMDPLLDPTEDDLRNLDENQTSHNGWFECARLVGSVKCIKMTKVEGRLPEVLAGRADPSEQTDEDAESDSEEEKENGTDDNEAVQK